MEDVQIRLSAGQLRNLENCFACPIFAATVNQKIKEWKFLLH
jgi:hypothetical protein